MTAADGPTTTTGAPSTSTPTTASTDTTPTTTPPPATAPTTTTAPADGVVALPHATSTAVRPSDGRIWHLDLHADAATGCVWATDADDGTVSSIAWYEGSTVRFDAGGGSAELRDETGRVVARAGERVEVTGGRPWQAQLGHCDVNGAAPDIGPLWWAGPADG